MMSVFLCMRSVYMSQRFIQIEFTKLGPDVELTMISTTGRNESVLFLSEYNLRK